MSKNWRGTPFEDAIPYGRSMAEVDAILDGLDAAGLLLTPERLEEIAKVVEEIDANGIGLDGRLTLVLAAGSQLDAFRRALSDMRRLAVEAVRAGGAAL